MKKKKRFPGDDEVIKTISAECTLEISDTITVPLEAYEDLIADSTVLRVIEHLVGTEQCEFGDYDLLRRVLGMERSADEEAVE